VVVSNFGDFTNEKRRGFFSKVKIKISECYYFTNISTKMAKIHYQKSQ
jgi:hypothetical protein